MTQVEPVNLRIEADETRRKQQPLSCTGLEAMWYEPAIAGHHLATRGYSLPENRANMTEGRGERRKLNSQ